MDEAGHTEEEERENETSAVRTRESKKSAIQLVKVSKAADRQSSIYDRMDTAPEHHHHRAASATTTREMTRMMSEENKIGARNKIGPERETEQ